MGDLVVDEINEIAGRMKVKAAARRVQAPVQLPFWKDPERVLPNALLRSALFGCARNRKYLDMETVASFSGTTVRFKGERFNQYDETVWMQLVHFYRLQGESKDFKVRFWAKSFLKTIGAKSVGGANIQRLRDSLARLSSGLVELEMGGFVYGGTPLCNYWFEDATGLFVAQLNEPQLKILETGHTRLDWETRKALSTGLATWMHRYVLSHRATKGHPHRIGLSTLHSLTGMESSTKEFRRHLSRIMPELKKHDVIADWSITPNDALEFWRPRQQQLLSE